MRELTVRLKFTTPCLGKVKQTRTISREGTRKKRSYFLFARDCDNKVVFMQQWWQSLMRRAADVACRYQREVRDIKFDLAVDGSPQPTPDRFFRRFYGDNRFSQHEAFFAGDIIGISCLVPAAITEDGLVQLLSLAGKYFGISPFRPGEFGFFKVVQVEKRGPAVEPVACKPKEQVCDI